MAALVIFAAGAVGLWVEFPHSSSGPAPPAPVPCSLGAFPPTVSSPQAALSAADAAYPPPANGSSSDEALSLWINTTGELLPGTTAGIAILPLPGLPSPSVCTLPIPASHWSTASTTLTLQPDRDRQVNVTGDPVSAYPREGVFAVQLWLNTTGSSGTTTLGSLHTELEVG